MIWHPSVLIKILVHGKHFRYFERLLAKASFYLSLKRHEYGSLFFVSLIYQIMTLIDKHNSAIQKLCARHQVKKLYAFGSVLTNSFGDQSDVDLLVEFYPLDVTNYSDNYFKLKFALEDMLQRPIDLIEQKALNNPFFKQAIETSSRILYAA